MSSPCRRANLSKPVSSGSPISLMLFFPAVISEVLHKMAICISRRYCASGKFLAGNSAAFSLFAQLPPGETSASTSILLSVSVPVLSVQMMVVPPSVSTAESLRTITFLRASLSIPCASARVATMDKPSGTAATASAMEVSNISRIGLPPTTPTPKMMTTKPTVILIRRPLNASNFFSNGVAACSEVPTRWAIFPNSVFMPVPVTTARPLPLVMKVPLKSRFDCSASGVSADNSPGSFSTGTLSPVREDSSACNCTLS